MKQIEYFMISLLCTFASAVGIAMALAARCNSLEEKLDRIENKINSISHESERSL